MRREVRDLCGIYREILRCLKQRKAYLLGTKTSNGFYWNSWFHWGRERERERETVDFILSKSTMEPTGPLFREDFERLGLSVTHG